MIIPSIIIGGALLLFGRKLYWLFVAGIGFFFAVSFVPRIFGNQPDWLTFVIAIGVGLIGALLAIFVQNIALGFAGFIAGGYFLSYALNLLGIELAKLNWLALIAGGILGAILVIVLFDWALIILSSISGTILILQSIRVSRITEILVFLGLAVVGVAVQAGVMMGERQPTKDD
jgi:hypothetical protein